MRTVRISDEVWEAIAQRGKFGETPDIVLRRVFGLDKNDVSVANPATNSKEREVGRVVGTRGGYVRHSRLATITQTARVRDDGMLEVSYESGRSKNWQLPARGDKARIRQIREEAVEFAKANRATVGQINAVYKALTDAGYHLTK
ncbi:MAG: hypothetical protein LDL07_11045 [Desulfarculus sp.]|nr:hypothetical protein [Desulfarculus sp.]